MERPQKKGAPHLLFYLKNTLMHIYSQIDKALVRFLAKAGRRNITMKVTSPISGGNTLWTPVDRSGPQAAGFQAALAALISESKDTLYYYLFPSSLCYSLCCWQTALLGSKGSFYSSPLKLF